ncbi:hypothetical protein HZH68_006911 [Vespula germanica]|uniref:Uncharacterized protein n=1 Tax=Vespula germanica TaxID=30212 RepID=A0A834K6P1_VESGE|nr:hypothetical protein HZH68_006911 [Vespula germanica]
MDGLARNWFRRGDCERAQLQPLLLPVTTTNTIAPTNSPSPSPSPSSSPSPLNDKDMVSTISKAEEERTGLPRGSNECTEEKEKIEGKRVEYGD